MRVFHLVAADAVRAHPDWNGCTPDRACEVWTTEDEARARQLAHEKFWQEATPARPDQTSPWTDPEIVRATAIDVPDDSPVPVDEAVFDWEHRLLQGALPQKQSNPNPDPSKKLDQH